MSSPSTSGHRASSRHSSPAAATNTVIAARQHGAGGRGVEYGAGAARFAGATYDPTSHYRAAAVFAFHVDQGLTPERLRALSRHQVGLLKTAFEALDVDPA